MTKLQKILPDLIKEVVKQILSVIMLAGREVIVKDHRGTKNGFYERILEQLLENLRT